MSPWEMRGLPARAPRHERVAELRVKAWECALQAAGAGRNGRQVPADIAWVVAHDALRSPATACRCPAVRSVLPADVLAGVLALAGAAPVTEVAAPASQPAASEAVTGAWLTTSEAARALGLTVHAVRAACRRGGLAATRGPAGEWQVDAASVSEYRRHHGRTASE